MPNPWFRLYSEFEDDPKVQMLPEAMQRRLVMLLCSRCKEVKLSEEQMAFKWRVSPEQVAETKETFLKQGFIDDDWNLINWNKRQFLSDSSTERVRKYRANHALKQDETLQKRDETKRNVVDTDTEADTEQKKKRPAKASPSLLVFPAWLPMDAWNAFVEMRKTERHPLTEAGIKLAIGKLEKYHVDGHNVRAILEDSTLKNYRGLFPVENNGNGKPAVANPIDKMRFVNTGGAR